MKAYRELSSLLVSRFYLDSFITGLFKAGIMSRSLEDAEAGGLHRRKNGEQQENLKVFKKLCLTKESQSYYLHFSPHSFRKQFRMRLFLKPVTQNCWFTLVGLESKDHVWIGDSSLGRWRKEQTEPCPRGRDVPYVEAVTTSSASRWDDLTQPTPSPIISSQHWFSTDRTTRKSSNWKDNCILRLGKARFSRSLKPLNCFSFPCGTELNV